MAHASAGARTCLEGGERGRHRAERLGSATFERIVIYQRGVRPTPIEDKGPMDMMLMAKGDIARMLGPLACRTNPRNIKVIFNTIPKYFFNI